MRTASWTDAVSVLDRLSAILDAFDGDTERGLGITELARRANLPKSTVSRIAGDLVAEGYLDRVDGRLHLGLSLFELGQSVEQPRRLRRVAVSIMTGLRDATGSSVQLAIADEDDVVVIANAAGRAGRFPAAAVGQRLGRSDTALGAAFAALERDSAEKQLKTYETMHAAHTCIAAPVHERGAVIAALSVSGMTGELDPHAVAPLLRRAASALSRRVAESA